MSVSLEKGQKVDLTKGNNGLSKIIVGLGWDEAAPKGAKGLFSSLLGKSTADIDCDASVLMLDENDKLQGVSNLIYFGNLKSKDGSVVHTGDNLTGEGDGDDEVILVDLSKVPKDFKKLLFIVNIYDSAKRHQDFGMIKNAFIRVVNSTNKQELIRYDLSDNYAGKTALIVGEIYRHDAEWKFGAIGESTTDGSLKTIIDRY